MITTLLITGAVLLFFKTIISLIASNYYDLKRINLDYERKSHPYKKIFTVKPKVTILISTRNSATAVIQTLDSVLNNPYKKTEVILIDNKSHKNQKQRIKKYAAHCKSVKVIFRKSKFADNRTLLSAVSRYSQGELILKLNPGETLAKDTLINSVISFNVNPEAQMVALRRNTLVKYSYAGLVGRYYGVNNNRLSKFHSQLKLPLSSSSAMYRAATLKNHLSAKAYNPSYVYCDRAVIQSNAAPPLAKLIKEQILNPSLKTALKGKAKHIPMVLINAYILITMPLVIGYSIYLALSLHEPRFFILLLAILTITLLTSIWQDRNLSLKEKFVYCLNVPIFYPFLLLQGILNCLSVIKFLLWPKFMKVNSA